MFARTRKNVLAVVVAITAVAALTTACGAGASKEASADCGALPTATASYNLRNLSDFQKKGNTYLDIIGDITGIPEGHTVWALLRNDKGECYMHTMTGNTPVNGGRLAKGDSIAKGDMAQMGEGDIHYVLVVADQADSRALEAFAHDGTPSPDRLVAAFGSNTYKVNRDQIQVVLY